MLKITRALLVATALTGSFAMPAAAQAPSPVHGPQAHAGTTLTLTVTGESSTAPDQATISFAVVTEGATAAEAMNANAKQMTTVMNALKSAGIEARHIRTSSINLQPRYNYPERSAPVLTGYQATNQVSVTIVNLNSVGPVIDTVVKAGVNQIDNIGFGLKDDTAATNQARQAAVRTLTERANLYASATGLKVVRLINLTEGSPSWNGPQPVMMRASAKMEDASTPVSGGELSLSVTVTATYELGK